MGISNEEIKTFSAALIKASNLSDSEWLNMEKMILETYTPGKNENASSAVREMWNQLNRKVEGAMERMKTLE